MTETCTVHLASFSALSPDCVQERARVGFHTRTGLSTIDLLAEDKAFEILLTLTFQTQETEGRITILLFKSCRTRLL